MARHLCVRDVNVGSVLCKRLLLPCLSVARELDCGTGVCACNRVLSASECTGASVSGITLQLC